MSVVIPAYRAAAHIRETLDSVFAQTYPNVEIVLVNDGSPDTEALEDAIRSYGEKLIYIRQENRGPSGARNTAIRAARGKYIACLDSDDIYLPWHLENLVPLLEERALDLAYCDSDFTRGGIPVGRGFERQAQNPPVTFEKLLNEECAVTTSAVVASRQAMIDAGLFDEKYRRSEDFDLWLRMAYRGSKMDLLREVGVVHRMLPDGLSADGYLLKLAQIDVYKKVMATLLISDQQKKAINELIVRLEWLCQKDLLKQCLRDRRYPEARAAADTAAALSPDSRSRGLALAVQIAPWAVRRVLLAKDARLARKWKSVPGSNRKSLTQEQSLRGGGPLQSKELETKET